MLYFKLSGQGLSLVNPYFLFVFLYFFWHTLSIAALEGYYPSLSTAASAEAAGEAEWRRLEGEASRERRMDGGRVGQADG